MKSVRFKTAVELHTGQCCIFGEDCPRVSYGPLGHKNVIYSWVTRDGHGLIKNCNLRTLLPKKMMRRNATTYTRHIFGGDVEGRLSFFFLRMSADFLTGV